MENFYPILPFVAEYLFIEDVLRLSQANKNCSILRDELVKSWAYGNFPRGSKGRNTFNTMLGSGIPSTNELMKLGKPLHLLEILHKYDVENRTFMDSDGRPMHLWDNLERKEYYKKAIIDNQLQNCIVDVPLETLLTPISRKLPKPTSQETLLKRYMTSLTPISIFYNLFLMLFADLAIYGNHRIEIRQPIETAKLSEKTALFVVDHFPLDHLNLEDCAKYMKMRLIFQGIRFFYHSRRTSTFESITSEQYLIFFNM